MDGRILDEVFAIIESRRHDDVNTSWTAKLLANAPDLPAKKLGEETAEAIIEAMKGDDKALTKEAADVIYHLLVVMAATNVKPEDVWAELKNRMAQSGIAEKASR